MYSGYSIHVVVPCFNVADHIDSVLSDMPTFVDRIFAVDDGSSDDTIERLERSGDPRLGIVRHSRNRGVGAAVISGFEQAVSTGADIIVKVDGDGQMDLTRLQTLLDALATEGFDYAKGNRLLDRRALSAMPRTRVVGNFALTFLTKLASGYWNILDPQNGYLAIRSRTWSLLDPSRLSTGYFFENDMLINLNIISARVKDVRMPARYLGESSHLRVRRVIPSFMVLLIRRIGYRFMTKYVLLDFSPIALFVLAGLPLFLWGVGFGAWAWWYHAQEGAIASTGTVMLSVLPLILGFELLLQALVLDIQSTPR